MEDKTIDLTIQVEGELIDMRADSGLAQYGVLSTRSQIRKLFDHKKVTINQKPIKPSHVLQEGDIIEVELFEEEKEELQPYDIPLDIVHEDDHVIIVNKPSGLVVHPAYGHKNDTLINALISHQKKLSSGSSQYRPGLVHRIDKGTSGLLVLAKDEKSHTSLSKQFKNKTVHRIYQAIIYGHLKEEDGTIETYITRNSSDRKKFTATSEDTGKKAITHYKTLRQSHHFSLIQLKLETGRTHQIRVHMNYLGHPIAGDDTYGGKKRAKNLASQELKRLILGMERFALHAKELGFVHPITHEQTQFDSQWPTDTQSLFDLTGLNEK